jgi:hypothetical protein
LCWRPRENILWEETSRVPKETPCEVRKPRPEVNGALPEIDSKINAKAVPVCK